MNEEMSDLPQAETADPDGVQVALRAAQTLWSRGETSESLKWLRKAAESASDEGADLRSLQLAKAAAELRAKLFGGGDLQRPGSGEISGAHPIADHPAAQSARVSSRSENEASGRRSSFPPDAGEGFASSGEHGSSHSSRPVTATQYPSHRPRQRMGLTSSVPGAPPLPREAYGTRDGAAYAAVPSWSADAERRVSAAPPPLPLASIDDYEELEAEPDDEPGDDPGSVWSSAGESWRATGDSAEPSRLDASGASRPSGGGSASAVSSAPSSGPSALGSGGSLTGTAASPGGSALPPPLPPRGAFAEDDPDFGPLTDQPTVVIPPIDDTPVGAVRDVHWTAAGDVWERESRISGWEQQDASASWAAELRGASWGQAPAVENAATQASSTQPSGIQPSGMQASAVAAPSSGASASPAALAASASLGIGLPAPGSEPAGVEPPPPSETAPAKLTARVHHQAVRVSFAPDLRVPGQYVVRALREGEKAAAGERIALLVALEPGVPLV